MPSAPRDDDALLTIAHALADRSAGAILPHFRTRLAVENKAGPGAFDPVTLADQAGEAAISALLLEAAPEHGLIGEEHGSRPGTSPYTWVIDPIDGTRAFIMGLPVWGTLIGLLEDSNPLLGMMNQPFTRERFWGSPAGSFFQHHGSTPERLSTRPCAGLADAVLSTTHPDLFKPAEAAPFADVRRQVRMTRYGGDCYAYCLLAAGHLDLIIETGLEAYDVVALIPIIERAGGVFTSWTGTSAAGGGRIVAAGDARVHAEALRILSAAA